MNRKPVYFVGGIDTDAGKSVATGWLAREWRAQGIRVVTQKLVQTGGTGMSEDIAVHRRIMGVGPLPEDLDFTTAPLRFSYPASPDLAARMEGAAVDLSVADAATDRLRERYDTVLIEGAGGLMTPIDGLCTMLDYAADRRLPLILVANPKLGSISHTLLSLEACRTRGVEVDMVLYNLHPAAPPEITDDTRRVIRCYLDAFFPACEWLDVPYIPQI